MWFNPSLGLHIGENFVQRTVFLFYLCVRQQYWLLRNFTGIINTMQIREINLLRESNVQLREENKHNFEECQVQKNFCYH